MAIIDQAGVKHLEELAADKQSLRLGDIFRIVH